MIGSSSSSSSSGSSSSGWSFFSRGGSSSSNSNTSNTINQPPASVTVSESSPECTCSSSSSQTPPPSKIADTPSDTVLTEDIGPTRKKPLDDGDLQQQRQANTTGGGDADLEHLEQQDLTALFENDTSSSQTSTLSSLLHMQASHDSFPIFSPVSLAQSSSTDTLLQQLPPKANEPVTVITGGSSNVDHTSPEPPVTTASPAVIPSGSFHLLSLTERKLEKAVLGRAVGLRQLVLLSNAFASRSSPPPTIQEQQQQASSSSSSYPSEYALQHPRPLTYGSDNGRSYFEDDELDARVIEYEEDEAERKRREEDWLDSVLDEMLTDAADDEEDDTHQQDTSQSRMRGTKQVLDERIPPSRSDREFKEPYVHLSIKHGWQQSNRNGESLPSSQIASPSLLPALSDLPASSSSSASSPSSSSPSVQHIEGHSDLEVDVPSILQSVDFVSDSGFLEPSTVPLPDSPESTFEDHSPIIDEVDITFKQKLLNDQDGLADVQYCGMTCQDWQRYDEAHEHLETVDEPTFESEALDFSHSRYDAVHRGIPISSTRSSLAPSPCSFSTVALPELAYSATSLLTNLSSSPGQSIHLVTPGTSPPIGIEMLERDVEERTCKLVSGFRDATAEEELDYSPYDQQASRDIDAESEDVNILMDDLDLDEATSASSSRDEDEDDKNTGSGSGSSTTSNEETTRVKRAMNSMSSRGRQVVHYKPARSQDVMRPNEDEDSKLQIPLYLSSTALRHTGLFSSPTVTTSASLAFGPQRPNLASTEYPALPSSLLSVMMGSQRPITVQLGPDANSAPPQISTKSSTDKSSLIPEDKLRLPIFLPSEIVKSLYDSVDFGLPPRFSPASSPLASPTQTSTATLPGFHFDNTSNTREAKSGAGHTATRSVPSSPRSRSRSLTRMEDTPSLPGYSPGGLLFSSLGLFGMKDDARSIPSFESMAASTSSTSSPSSFGRGIVHEWERRRSTSSIPSSSTGSTGTSSRNESRSPSRLRLYLEQETNYPDDFEFGTI